MARPPLVRAGLFVLGRSCARLAVTFDHLIADGNGVSIFMRELLEAYHATTAGRPPAPAPLRVQFADFVLWQRANVTEEVLRRQLEWWARALEGMPLGPAVPFDHLPAEPSRRIASYPVAVAPAARAGIEELARATSSTPFVVVLAGVQAVLARASGSTDIVLSTTLSGRNRAELEGLVGTFSGIGRLRTDLAGDPPFVDVVARARDFVVGLYENQDIPFMRVRRVLLPDFPAGGVELAAALPIELAYFPTDGHDPELFFRGQLHPLSITLLDDGSRIWGTLSYKVDFYEAATIERLACDIEAMLDGIADVASLPLSKLPVSRREPAPPRP